MKQICMLNTVMNNSNLCLFCACFCNCTDTVFYFTVLMRLEIKTTDGLRITAASQVLMSPMGHWQKEACTILHKQLKGEKLEYTIVDTGHLMWVFYRKLRGKRIRAQMYGTSSCCLLINSVHLVLSEMWIFFPKVKKSF